MRTERIQNSHFINSYPSYKNRQGILSPSAFNVSNTQDCFVKSTNQQITFTGGLSVNEFIIKFLKNKSYDTSIKASRRPYLSVCEELGQTLQEIQIKVSKNEYINAFDINPKNSNKYVIFLHGFSQNITSNQPLYNALKETNYGILAIDYRGYGHNKMTKHKNENDIMQDVRGAVKFLNSKGVNNIGLIGHSFGGYIAAKTSNLSNFNFQILVSPMLSLEFWLKNVLKNPKKYKLEAAMIKYVPGFKEQYSRIFEIDKHITSNTTPTYVVHSKTDGYITTKDVTNFTKKIFNPKEYILIPKGGHRMDESKISCIKDILNKL